MNNNTFTHAPTGLEVLTAIRDEIPKYITGKRLIHTYAVEKEALRLSEILFPVLGIDKKYLSDISASALLHDITKQFSKDEQLEICRKYGIPFSEYDAEDSAVIHSRTGAYIAREKFSVNDFVFGAIYSHTTGKADMNIFEKIIFTADYIEETRTHSCCVSARNFFYGNLEGCQNASVLLDKTILMSIDSTLSFLIEKGCLIDIETVNARNCIISHL